MQRTRETYDNEGNVITTEVVYYDPRPEALTLLAVSDLVALRCFKSGIDFPDEWKSFTTTLRDVVNGTSSQLPSKPAFPQGT